MIKSRNFKFIGIFIFLYFLLVFLPIRQFTADAQNASSSIVMEIESGRVLSSSNESVKMPMASTTKILTAIIIIEDMKLGEEVIIPNECVGIEGSSVYLKEGDKYTVEELLYALMLRSGNDCAVCLALKHSGSIEKFAAVMNERAKNYGATESNFTNPHGLHDDNHYTTALDLAKITRHAMMNKTFRQIVGSKNKSFGERTYYNKNKLLSSYEFCTGVKTGYTTKAGRCLVSSAKKDGMEVVSVVLNEREMYERSKLNMEQAFSDFSMTDFESEGSIMIQDKKVDFKTNNAVRIPLKKEELNNIKRKVILENNLTLPIEKRQKIGKLQFYIENQLIFCENLYSIKSVEKNYFDILDEVIQNY